MMTSQIKTIVRPAAVKIFPTSLKAWPVHKFHAIVLIISLFMTSKCHFHSKKADYINTKLDKVKYKRKENVVPGQVRMTYS